MGGLGLCVWVPPLPLCGASAICTHLPLPLPVWPFRQWVLARFRDEVGDTCAGYCQEHSSIGSPCPHKALLA